ncbi:MAG TPA: 3-dehydroquinate synthase [Bacillota bacterium]|nr:3-dehydroquinate synthase [Bacillota bacterium]
MLLVSNPIVDSLYGDRLRNSLEQAGFQPITALMPDGEEYKTMATAMQLFDAAVAAHIDRKCPLIALGGGVTGDMAGFVAATYMRGLPFIQVPTTLLAQVDSSVGGKVAVNHPQGKNIIGAFYQPKLVWIDVDVLKSLPPRELRAGLGEVVKYGLIWDKNFFSLLEKEAPALLQHQPQLLGSIISTSCNIKAQVVARDEREENLRAILNLGHTFGHALETLTNYRKYRHGEAVAIGMNIAARVSAAMGLYSDHEADRVEKLLNQLGLPVWDRELTPEAIVRAMYHDKKAVAGRISYIIPEAIGQVRITKEVPEELVLKVLEGE